MKLKNIGTSIVSIGKTVILPDETVDISDKGYQNNDAIDFLVSIKRLAIVKERAASSKKEAAEKEAVETAAAKSKE